MSHIMGIPTIPKSIVQAICKVQAAVGAVAKSEKNTHGGYSFASTDAVYAQFTHKLAQAGLVILCLEETPPEIVRVEGKDGKVAQWGKFCFSFILATEEATWSDPRSRRSLFIQITGPQTFMGAQSYAEKAYLRSLFKLPTGDHDLDAMAQAATEEDQVALNNGNGKRKASAEGKRDGSVKRFNDLKAAIFKADGAIDCAEIWKQNGELLRTLPRAWFETLAQDFVAKMGDHGVELDCDEHGWPILEMREVEPTEHGLKQIFDEVIARKREAGA